MQSMSGNHSGSRAFSVLAVLGVFGLAVSLSVYQELMEDVPWHLKIGQWIWQHHAVPQVDFYSFTRAGQEWLDAQWLFQIICYLSYEFLGEPGITALTLTLTLLLLLVSLAAVPGRVPWGLRSLAGVVFLLSLSSRLACRPELLSFLCMALLFFFLERALRGRTRFLIAVPLVQVVWVNCEGLWPLGWGILGAYLGDYLLQARSDPAFSWKRPLPAAWATAAGCSLLAGALQPYGLRGLLFPLTLLQEVTQPSNLLKQSVIEFWPLLGQHWVPGIAIPFLLLAFMAAAVTLAAGKKLRPGLSLLGLALIVLALRSRRNVGVASVVLLPLLLLHLEFLLQKPLLLRRGETLSRWASLLALAGAVVFALLSQVPQVRTWDGSGRERGVGLSAEWFPRQAAEFLWQLGYRGNLINDDRTGGYLIWYGWPDWKVFYDSRMELGGEAANRLYFRVFSDPLAFRAVAEQYHVDAVLVHYSWPYYRNFLARLLTEPDWALVYQDPRYAVCLRRSPEWQRVIEQTEITIKGSELDIGHLH